MGDYCRYNVCSFSKFNTFAFAILYLAFIVQLKKYVVRFKKLKNVILALLSGYNNTKRIKCIVLLVRQSVDRVRGGSFKDKSFQIW